MRQPAVPIDLILLLQPNVAIVGFGEIQSGFLLRAAFVLGSTRVVIKLLFSPG
jgi:hypothetical protein